MADVETKPLPALALSAIALLRSTFQREAALLIEQTQEWPGFTKAEGWSVNVDTGVATRPLPPDNEAVVHAD